MEKVTNSSPQLDSTFSTLQGLQRRGRDYGILLLNKRRLFPRMITFIEIQVRSSVGVPFSRLSIASKPNGDCVVYALGEELRE